MKHFDYIILGAGISGLTFGRLLQQKTNKQFLIIEKEKEPGGLCRTMERRGNYFDIGGGHFLYTKHQEVYDFIFSHLPVENFNKHIRNTKIFIHNQFIDYPIENNLWQLPKDLKNKYVLSLLDGVEFDLKNINKKSFNVAEFFKRKLGEEIYNNYLRPYNNKLWGVDASEMDSSWLYKTPSIDYRKVISSIIMDQCDNDNIPSHHYFYYPKSGGFGEIVKAIADPLEEENKVVTNQSVNSLEYSSNRWIVNNEITCDKIINTVPWTALPIYTECLFNQLKHTSLVTAFKTKIGDVDWQWCYYPDNDYLFHRRFNVNGYCNNPDQFICDEIHAGRWWANEGYKDGYEFYYVNEYAYPIPTMGYKNVVHNILDKFSQKNFFGLGRWGEWEHHNSDVCIFNAMKLFRKLES